MLYVVIKHENLIDTDEVSVIVATDNITCGMDSADFENTFDNAIYGWESNFSFTMNELTSNEDI